MALIQHSAHEYYMTFCHLFEKCSLVVGAELRCQLGELKLKEGGDACAHIEKIIALREDLASIGCPVTDENLFNIVYASLPRSYNPGLAVLSSTMRLQGSTITSDDLMDIVLEEYNWLTLQNRGKGKSSSSKDVAFRADTSSKKGKGKGKKFGGDCWNCGWSGHKHPNCWEEGGGKASQAPKGWKPHGKKVKDDKSKSKSSVSVNVTTSDKDTTQPDSAWLAMPESESLIPNQTNVFLA